MFLLEPKLYISLSQTPGYLVLGIGNDMEEDTRTRINEDVDSSGYYLQKFKLYETHSVNMTAFVDTCRTFSSLLYLLDLSLSILTFLCYLNPLHSDS